MNFGVIEKPPKPYIVPVNKKTSKMKIILSVFYILVIVGVTAFFLLEPIL